MEDYSSLLNQVENLTIGFLGSSGERNNDLEQLLRNFRTGLKEQAGNVCCYFLQSSKTNFVRWFAFTAFEEFIKLYWEKLSHQEASNYREFLFQYTVDYHFSLERYALAKLIKIQVDIAKRDWPQKYPSFFKLIHVLLQEPGTCKVGFEFLKSVCEDFVSTKEDIAWQRKKVLKEYFSTEVPSILNVCISYLDMIYEKFVLIPVENSTPYSSPISKSQITDDVMSRQTTLGFTDISRQSFPTQMFLSSSIKEKYFRSGQLSKEQLKNCQLCFDILLSLFNWINLSNFLQENYLRCILNYVHLCSDNDLISLSILSLGCVTEIYCRSFAPAELSTHITSIFSNLHELLIFLCEDKSRALLGTLDEDFIIKLCEVIRLFFKNHLLKCLNLSLPIDAFLEQFMKFTFSMGNHEHVSLALEIWKTFLDDMNEISSLKQFSKYYGLICVQVLQKVQMRENSHFLSEINDAQGLTDLDLFVNECFDLVAKVGSQYPAEVLNIVIPILDGNLDSIGRSGISFTSGNRLNGSTFVLIKDIRMAFRIYGRLCEVIFCNESFNFKYNSLADNFNEKLLCFCQALLPNLNEYASKSSEFEKLVEQVLATAISFVQWLKLCLQVNSNYQSLYTSYLELGAAFVNSNAGEKITCASLRLLLSVASAIKLPERFCTVPSMKEMIQNFPHILYGLSETSKTLLIKSFSYALVFSSSGEKMSEPLHTLFSPFFPVLPSLKTMGEDQVIQLLKQQLLITKILTELVKEENSNFKKGVFEFIAPSLDFPINVLSEFNCSNDVLCLTMSTHYSIFIALKAQIGFNYISRTSNFYISRFNHETLLRLSNSSKFDESSGNLLKRLFEYLSFLIEEPGRAFSQLTDSVVDFTVSSLFPSIVSHQGLDIPVYSHDFYKLIKLIITFKFKNLFPQSIRSSANTAETSILSEKVPAIMETILFGLKLSDLNSFKECIDILHQGNDRNYLFHQENFRKNFLPVFMDVLVDDILRKSHDIMREEVVQVIFEMAKVDEFDYFMRVFLPGLISKCPDQMKRESSLMTASFSSARDYPSFSLQFQVLINDYCFWKSTCDIEEGTKE